MSTISTDPKAAMTGIWDRAASKYSKVGPDYWNYFGQKLAYLSDIVKGHRVLDIGCGRGASLFPAARILKEQGELVGIDLSKSMIDETRKEASVLGLDDILLKVMDAEKLDFPDGSFDRVLCGFGLPYLAYQENKLAEVSRVLKSDGQASFSVWSMQEDTAWIQGLVSKHLPPVQAPTGSQRASSISIDNPEGVSRLLLECGFVEVRTILEDKVFTYKDEDEWWQEMWANAVRATLEWLQTAGQEKLEAFKAAAFEGLKQFKDARGIHFKRSVIYALCKKI